MLRASRRLLRPGGRTALATIHPAAGLSQQQRRRAARDGPPAVATSRPQLELLDAAGFVDLDEIDVTAEFRVTANEWIVHYDAHQDELVAQLGEQLFVEGQDERRAQLRAVDDGLLRRSLLAGTRPIRAASGSGRHRPVAARRG